MQTLAFGELIDSCMGKEYQVTKAIGQALHVALPLCPYALPQPDKDLWTANNDLPKHYTKICIPEFLSHFQKQ
jgi:hypothetical protein